MPNWEEHRNQLLGAGFSVDDTQGIASGIADQMTKAGKSDQEIADYFGKPPEPEAGKLSEYLNQQFKAALPHQDMAHEETHGPTRMEAVAQGLKTAITAGYQGSVIGLRARGQLPDTEVEPKSLFFEGAPAYERVAQGVAQTIMDAPVMGMGALMAAPLGPIGSMGGAFAVPQGLRAALVDSYTKGGVHSFRDFLATSKVAAEEGGKGFITGVVTGVAGKVAGALAPATGIMSKAAPMAAELTAMTTTGAALDGHMPEPRDFLDNALIIGGMHALGIPLAKLKLEKTYTDTGIHPQVVAAEALSNPVVRQELLSHSAETPPSLKPYVEPSTQSSKVMIDGHLYPVNEAVEKGAFTFNGTPAEFAKDAAKRFSPEERMKAAQAHDPAAFKSLNEMSKDLKDYQARIKEHEDAIKSNEGKPEKADENQTRRNEIASLNKRVESLGENASRVKERLLNAFKAGHETLVSNLKDRVRNADLPLGETENAKAQSQFNPEFTSQDDHSLSMHKDAKENIASDEAAIQKLMGEFANHTPEDGMHEALSKHPELAEIIAPEMVEKQVSPETGEKTLRILPRAKRSVEKVTLNNAIKYAYNDLAPLKLPSDVAERMGNFPLANKAEELALHSRASVRRAEAIIGREKDPNGVYGVFDIKTGKKVFDSLYKILEDVKSDIQGFKEYLLYKQAIDENNAGRSTGVNQTEAEKFVKENASRFDNAAKKFTGFHNAFLEHYIAKSGYRSAEMVREWIEKHPNYATGNRVDETKAGTSGKTGTPFKTRKGSELPYLDPVTASVLKIENAVRAVEENLAKQAIVERDLALHKAGEETFLKIAEKKASSLDDANLGDLTFSSDARQRLSDNQMGYYENGEYKVATFKDPEVAKLMNFAKNDIGTYKALTLAMKPFQLAATATRFAVSTGSNFIVNHILRSEAFTSTIAKEHRIPILGSLEFIHHVVGKDSPLFAEALKAGVFDGVMSEINQKILNDRAYTLGDEHGALGTVANTIKNVAGVGHEIINLQESAKRLSVFKALKDAKPDATWDDILKMGKETRRSTVDGLQRGAGMQFLNSIIPFMHYEIQGLGRNIEAWKEQPGRMAVRTGLMASLTALNWFANKDDEDVQNQPDYIKNAFWNFKVGDNVLHIAKDWGEGKIVCSFVERSLDAIVNHNPRAMDGMVETMKNIVPIPFLNRNPALIEAFNVMHNNFNSLTGHNYIPDYMMNKLAPESRAMPYTSVLARKTAGLLEHLNGLGLNLDSPMVMDYAIKQFGGDNARSLIQLSEKALESAGVIAPTAKPAYEAADLPFVGALIARRPTYAAQPLKDFDKEYKSMEQNYNTYQDYLTKGQPEEAAQFHDKHPDLDYFPSLQGSHELIHNSTRQIQLFASMPNDLMPASDKKQLSEDLWKIAIMSAKTSLDSVDDLRENIK